MVRERNEIFIKDSCFFVNFIFKLGRKVDIFYRVLEGIVRINGIKYGYFIWIIIKGECVRGIVFKKDEFFITGIGKLRLNKV